MSQQSGLTHPHYDIELEPIQGGEAHLVKILALDGRRFTYRVETNIDAETIEVVRNFIDMGVLSDLVIRRIEGQFQSEPAASPLKKHG